MTAFQKRLFCYGLSRFFGNFQVLKKIYNAHGQDMVSSPQLLHIFQLVCHSNQKVSLYIDHDENSPISEYTYLNVVHQVTATASLLYLHWKSIKVVIIEIILRHCFISISFLWLNFVCTKIKVRINWSIIFLGSVSTIQKRLKILALVQGYGMRRVLSADKSNFRPLHNILRNCSHKESWWC